MEYKEMMDDQGQPLPQPLKIEPESPIKQFFTDTINCLIEPRLFFTERYPHFTLTQALVFSVILNWIATVLEWLTRVVRHETLLDGLVKIREQLDALPMWKDFTPHLFSEESMSSIPAWILELISVSINPFKTLFGILITALFVWLGALIFIPKKEDQDPIDYAHFIKLMAVATSAPKLVGAILGFLPFGLGTLIGAIYVFYIEMYSIAIRYKVSGLRAMTVVILPSLLILIVGSCVIGIVLAVIFGALGSFSH